MVYCTLGVSGEQFFLLLPIQTWAAVETSDSVTQDASTANTCLTGAVVV